MPDPRHDLHDRDWRAIKRLAQGILVQAEHYAHNRAKGHDDRIRAYVLRDRELSRLAERMRRRYDKERGDA